MLICSQILIPDSNRNSKRLEWPGRWERFLAQDNFIVHLLMTTICLNCDTEVKNAIAKSYL